MSAQLNETVVPAPLFISGRLMAAYTIDGAGTVHVEAHEYDGENRVQYRWVIEDASGRELETGDDLRSGVGAEIDYAAITATLLAFLEAASEASADGENSDLFSAPVMEWAAQHSDELAMARLLLEEGQPQD